MAGGAQFGGYTLLRKLGADSRSEFFLAKREDGAADQTALVLRRILPELRHDEAAVAFLNEQARLAENRSPPQRVLDRGERSGLFFFVVEDVEGLAKDLTASEVTKTLPIKPIQSTSQV